jgi:hypothetical protein
MSVIKELLEAARRVAFFEGATEENLQRLRAAVSEADHTYLCQDEEDDDEEDDDDDAETEGQS